MRIKINILTISILLNIFCLANTSNSKNFTDFVGGIVVYNQKISVRAPVSKSDTLKFNRSKSIFQWNRYNPSVNPTKKAKKKYPSAKIKGGGNGKVITGQVNLLDLSKDSLYSRMSMRMIDKVFFLKEKSPQINWNIKDSTKHIGSYEVKKATARFRGRNYTAWFTPKIPVPYGPWKLHGLPGLILQAYSQDHNIYFSAISVKLKDVGTIGTIHKNGMEQIITLPQYIKIMNHFKQRMKTYVIKRIRNDHPSGITNKQLANYPIELPDIELIETFADSTDQ